MRFGLLLSRPAPLLGGRVTVSEHEVVDLNELIRKAQDLEPLPMSATRLAALVADPRSNADQLIDVIRLDQSLTARVLRWANSASSAARGPITNVRDAVVRMGRGAILELAIGTRASKLLSSAVPEYGLNEQGLWRHSVATALVAESLAPHVRVDIPPEAFAAALLHDVGKLVLARFLEPETLEFLRRAQEDAHLDPLAAEIELLEVHHGELGGLVVRNWGLPESIAIGISYHHNPDEGRSTICDVVCVADEIAKTIEAAKVPREPYPRDHSAAYQRLGLAPEKVSVIHEQVTKRFADVLERFK